MEIKDDAAMRGLVLGVLYAGKDHSFVKVKPDSFSPPMTMRDIGIISREFKNATPHPLIIGSPSKNGDGYFMRISVHGQAVWEGNAHTELDISGLPHL
jgi:hypothetical protein